MTNEEMNTIEIEEVEVIPTNEEDYEEEGRSGLGSVLVKGALGLGAAGIGAVGALAFKNKEKIKNKITARQIKKLEKKGYLVSEFDEGEEVEVEIEEVVEEKPKKKETK